MGKVMERKYKCPLTGVEEITRFAVGENTEARPRWRKAKTAEDKREENHRHAARELARIFNCNLTHEGFFVMLDYSQESYEKIFAGMDEDQILRESKRQGALFVRRLKRYAGTEIKCAFVASDRDIREDGTLAPCRIHNHAVVMGATEEQIRKAWKLGSCTDVRRIWRQEDYTPLAVYMVSQVRSLENYKKYQCTRNMDKPIVQDRVVKGDPGEEIRVQSGAKILDRMTYREGSVVQYVRYKRRPKSKKRGGHKEGSDENTACGGPELSKEKTEEGGSGFDFSKIAWG